MKTDTDLMNKVAHNTTMLRELTTEESIAMKLALVDIYKDIAALCEKNGLTYMLAGGSCLGAVRHKGFIPWDDDLDLMMPRSDYDKFIELCEKGNIGDKYEMTYPNKKKDSKNLFMKVYRKNSLNLEVMCDNMPFPCGLYIDIFPIDRVPNNKVVQRIKGWTADVLHFIAVSVLYSQYPSKSMKEYSSLNKTLERRYKLRCFIGNICGVFSHKRWAYWYDSFVQQNKHSKFLCLPTGRKHYCGEILPQEVYIPTTKAMFEGVEVNIPGDYDTYLKNLYGDYMQLPPEDKRERHFVMDFKLPDD